MKSKEPNNEAVQTNDNGVEYQQGPIHCWMMKLHCLVEAHAHGAEIHGERHHGVEQRQNKELDVVESESIVDLHIKAYITWDSLQQTETPWLNAPKGSNDPCAARSVQVDCSDECGQA
mgnify:CR=1 FL=1